MSDLFAVRRAAEDREAAALVKKRVGVSLAARVCGIGRACPHCGQAGALFPSADDQSWACRPPLKAPGCGARGDVISLVRLSRRLGFHAALAFLNDAASAPPAKAPAWERLL